jgi:hypothetical protein
MGEEKKILDFRKYFKKFRKIPPGAGVGLTAGKRDVCYVMK